MQAIPTLGKWFLLLRDDQKQITPLCVVIAILAYATYKKKSELSFSDGSLNYAGIAFLTSMAALRLGATIFYCFRLELLGLIGMFAGLIWSLTSNKTFSYWFPSFLFSLLLIPEIPNDQRLVVSQPMQRISADLAMLLAQTIIPIKHEGNTLWVKGDYFEVAPECSGLNMWVAYFGLLLLFQLFVRCRLWFYPAVCLAVPLITIVLNSVRIAITALVAYFSSFESAMSIHSNLEYVTFPLGLLLLWLIGKKFYVTPP